MKRVVMLVVLPLLLFAQQWSGDWVRTTDKAPWAPRGRMVALTYHDTLWVMGGYDGVTRYRDVWYSADGITWNLATDNAAWSARYGHAGVVFRDTMWIFGGLSSLYRNDVWYSTDGVNWTLKTANAGWPVRYHHTVVVRNDTVWLMGGYNSTDSLLNDVWFSTNCSTWTQATASAAWTPRRWHASVTFNNRLWVLAGYDGSALRDVWSSLDGATWTQVNPEAWPVRYRHAVAIHDNKIWVLGGYGGITYRNDVWYSSNGAAWIQMPVNAGWSPRFYHASTVRDGKIWIFGGYQSDGRFLSDAWYSGGRAIVTVAPNGGEYWAGGTTRTIRWRRAGATVSQYRLLLSVDGGVTYTDTLAYVSSATDSTYNWNVSSVNSATCRIKVQALSADSTVLVEDASDADFVIDSEPPAVFSLLNPANGDWGQARPTFIWQKSSDNIAFSRYQLYIDGVMRKDSITDTAYVYTTGLAEGPHNWFVVALDRAGNRRSSDTFLLRVDSTPPVAFNLRYPADSTWTTGAGLEFAWEPTTDVGAGLTKYQLWFDGVVNRDNILPTESTTTYQGTLVTGEHVWQIRALDGAGNGRVSNQTYVLFVDATPPNAFSLVYPPNSSWIAERHPEFTWRSTADTGIGLSFWRLYVDGVLARDSIPAADTNAVLPYPLSDTIHTWYVEAVDGLGNTRASAIWWYGIDSTPPLAFGLVAPPDSAALSIPTPVFVWNRSDDATIGFWKYELWVDGVLNIDSLGIDDTTSAPTTPLTEGWHTWYVRALDKLGNVRVSNQTFVLALDLTPPDTFSLAKPANNDTVYFQQPRLHWHPASDGTGSGIGKYQLWVNGVMDRDNIPAGDTSTTTVTTLPFGSINTWYVRAFDRAGGVRVSNQTWTFTVIRDTIAPTVPILSSPANGAHINDTLPVFFWRKSCDGNSGVHYYTLVYASDSLFTDPITVNITDTTYQMPVRPVDSIWYWRVRATDEVGNQSAWSAVWSFEVDTRVPATPSLVWPTGGAWSNTARTVLEWMPVNFGSFSPVRYVVQLDTIVSFPSPREDTTATNADTVALAERHKYFWRVRAYDLAGNQGSFSGADSFGVDYTPPMIPVLVGPDSGAILNDSMVTFVWRSAADNLSGVSHYVLQFANNPDFISPITQDSIADTTFTPAPLADTFWFWRVRTVDKAANQSSWSAVRSFEVDTRTPAVPTLVEPVAGAWNNAAATVFKWTPVSFATTGTKGSRAELADPFSPVRYMIQVDTAASFPSPVIDTTSSNEDTLVLAERARYFWRVRAFDLAGNQGNFSAADSFGVDRTVPFSPTLVLPDSGAMLNDSLVTFVWRPAYDSLSGVSHYVLQFANNSGFSGAVTKDSLTDTTFTSGVLADTFWYWRVRCVDRAGNLSAWSQVRSLEIDTKVPQAPTLAEPASAAWLRDSVVAFRWSSVTFSKVGEGTIMAPVRYILQVDTSRSFPAPLVVDTLYVPYDTVKLEQARYFWRVRAFDMAGNQGGFSNVDSFGCDWTAPTVPMLAYPPNDTTLKDTVFGFFWYPSQDRPSGVADYRIQLALDTTFANLVRDTVVKDTSYRVRLADTVYYWRVRATDRAGNRSVWSGYRKLRAQRAPAVEERPAVPVSTRLVSVNPVLFRNGFEVVYTLASSTPVRLSLYNSLGTEIAVLVEGQQAAGSYRVIWNDRHNKVPAGIYFMSLEAGRYAMSKKITKLE